MEPGFKPTSWLGIVVSTLLYIDFCSEDEMTKNMEALCKEIGNLGRTGCDEVDGMYNLIAQLFCYQHDQ